jgi:hypothetical protein
MKLTAFSSRLTAPACAVAIVLLAASSAIAQAPQAAKQPLPPGQRTAMRMVAAQVALRTTLDAASLKHGDLFEAKLAKKIQLSNGPLLPAGTVLVGKVAQDDMKTTGTSKFALRFMQARLKDGTLIPVKATIVGAFGPQDLDAAENSTPGAEIPNNWNDGTLQVDQLNVTPGVDLHSSIASGNSGVFVSTKRQDVHLDAGSELALAIAYQKPAPVVAANSAK